MIVTRVVLEVMGVLLLAVVLLGVVLLLALVWYCDVYDG